MEIDEEFEQIDNISAKVARTILEAIWTRFKKFDYYEKSVILSSFSKIIVIFLMDLSQYERKHAILSIIDILNTLHDQNEKL